MCFFPLQPAGTCLVLGGFPVPCSVLVQIPYECTSDMLVLVSLSPTGVTLNPVASACSDVEPSNQLCVSSHVAISVILLGRNQL